MPDPTTVSVLLVIFFSYTVNSALGFAGALISVPLLAMLQLDLKLVMSFQALLAILMSGWVVVQDWRQIQVRSAIGLGICVLLGVPLGLWVLKVVRTDNLCLFIGSIVIAFALYSLTLRSRLHLAKDHPLAMMAAGFTSGILSAATSMDGPPLVIYSSLRRWSPQGFRATLQSVYLASSSAALIGYFRWNIWRPAALRYFLWCIPAMLAAILVGRWLNHRCRGQIFFRIVYIGLILIGGMLIMQGLKTPAAS